MSNLAPTSPTDDQAQPTIENSQTSSTDDQAQPHEEDHKNDLYSAIENSYGDNESTDEVDKDKNEFSPIDFMKDNFGLNDVNEETLQNLKNQMENPQIPESYQQLEQFGSNVASMVNGNPEDSMKSMQGFKDILHDSFMNNPIGFSESFQDIINQANLYNGNMLTDELFEKVNNDELSKEQAIEIQRNQIQQEFNNRELERLRNERQQQNQQQQNQQQQNELSTNIDNQMQEITKNDPRLMKIGNKFLSDPNVAKILDDQFKNINDNNTKSTLFIAMFKNYINDNKDINDEDLQSLPNNNNNNQESYENMDFSFLGKG